MVNMVTTGNILYLHSTDDGVDGIWIPLHFISMLGIIRAELEPLEWKETV